MVKGFYRGLPVILVLAWGLLPFNQGCRPKQLRILGSYCDSSDQCESGICIESNCRSGMGDFDHDKLTNGQEINIYHTDPKNKDTDGDGVDDYHEVYFTDDGKRVDTPPDDDGDGIINALESSSLTADSDHDCIPDQMDPQNDEYNDPKTMEDKLKKWFCLKGICADYADVITAKCVQGHLECDHTKVKGWQKVETECDGLDNDCDGQTDEGLERSPIGMDPNPCPTKGVCADYADLVKVTCQKGKWTCDYSAVAAKEPAYEAVEHTCDGVDNDCDGMTDEINSEPGSSHGCKGVGVCGGDNTSLIKAFCVDSGWACDYSALKDQGYQDKETLCDGLDNDCNGTIDDPWPEVAHSTEDTNFQPAKCTVGKGICKRTGQYRCSDDHTGIVCNATPGTPADSEDCTNNLDDDCNGVVNDYCGTPVPVEVTILGNPTRTDDTATLSVYKAEFCKDRTVSGNPTINKTVPLNKGFSFTLSPGGYCLHITATGYRDVTSNVFYLYENEVQDGHTWPINIVLNSQNSQGNTMNIAGRVFRFNHNAIDTSQLIVASMIQQDGTVQSIDPAYLKVTADHGHFSITGLPEGTKDNPVTAYRVTLEFSAGSKIPVLQRTFEVKTSDLANNLLIHDLWVYPDKDAVCFKEGFDFSPDLLSKNWVTNGYGGGVTWQVIGEGIKNNAIGNCVTLSDQESHCSPSDAGCCLCGNPKDPDCIPDRGALPNPYEGSGAAWFGNPKLGNYSYDPCTSSDPAGGISSPVLGDLETSDYVIDLTRAQVATLTFWTAFEVETGSNDTATMDKMVVFLEPEQSSNGSQEPQRLVIDTLNNDKDSGHLNCNKNTCTSGEGMPCWKKVTINLTMYKGKRYRLGFEFDSVDDYRNSYRGWMIDNIRLEGTRCLVLDDSWQ